MILMLDIDGVLHHGDKVTLHRVKQSSVRWLKDHERRYLTATGHYIKGKNLFEHSERLAATLAPYPDIKIVITSTWREHFRPMTLLRYLPQSLADRVIGQTPHFDKYGGVGARLQEVLAYLHGNGLGNEPWIALDDQAQLYWDDTENPPDELFIVGEEGLTETATAAFNEFLKEKTK